MTRNVLILCLLWIFSFGGVAETIPKHSSGNVPANIQEQIQRSFEAVKSKGPRFSLSGKLEIGRTTSYSINGVDFEIGKGALIIGDLAIGSEVKVRGDVHNGKRTAVQVFVNTPYSKRPSATKETGGPSF